MEQTPKRNGIGCIARSLKCPRLKSGAKRVYLDFEVFHLFCEFDRVEEDRPVSEIYGEFAQILHQNNGVDGTIEILDRRLLDFRLGVLGSRD